jgi:hypothetical protein
MTCIFSEWLLKKRNLGTKDEIAGRMSDQLLLDLVR